eukprot:7382417-Karenia_brevis.AAC.1
MESRLESVRAEIEDQYPTDPTLLKTKIFQQTWNEIKYAKDAAGRDKYTIPGPLDMTSRGGVWGETQASQPSPTSPAEADAEMGG